MKKLYTGECNIIGFENYKPIGDLVVDYSFDDLKIKHYYIREWYFEDLMIPKYNDFRIDSESIIDITDLNNPIMLGIDNIAKNFDVTYLGDNEYSVRED